jgi:hypothetical protein
MLMQQLRDVRDAVPFQPFVIRMTDGQSYPIPHRDYLSIAPNGRIALVYRTDSETYRFLDIMLITRLEVDPTPASPSTAADANGA